MPKGSLRETLGHSWLRQQNTIVTEAQALSLTQSIQEAKEKAAVVYFKLRWEETVKLSFVTCLTLLHDDPSHQILTVLDTLKRHLLKGVIPHKDPEMGQGQKAIMSPSATKGLSKSAQQPPEKRDSLSCQTLQFTQGTHAPV